MKRTIKKSMSLFLAVVMLVCAVPFAASAYTEYTEGCFTFVVNGGNEAEIIDCDESISGDVVIPDVLGGYPVKTIGWNAFSDCIDLTSITIPDSVIKISSYAFSGCTGLTSITIPNSVTSIDDLAFSGCTGLTSITIPDSVTSIGSHTFEDCIGLTSVTIPDSVISIGENAFSGCTGLTSITIPNSVTSIGADAFSGCTGLTSITVSPGNKVYHSENNCIINTEEKALVVGCKNSVIPSDGSVTSIGYSAFEGCTGLTSITIPDSVIKISGWAFSDCTGLTSITIPDSVTYIDSSAFEGCTGLTSITVNPGNKVYHSKNNCIINTEEKALVVGCKNSVIPSDGSVTSIGFCAFSDCTTLTSITISDSVILIGGCAFENCTGLTSITILDSVTNIAGYAFYGCTGLTSITIPNSVTNIGDEAFGYYDEGAYASAKISNFTIYGYTGTAAETYANENGFTFIPLEDDENEAKNESTGISIIYPDNAYSNDIQLNVSVVTSGSAFNVLNTEKASFKKSLFDISTTIDGEKVQPNGTVLVKIPLPEGFNPEKTVVYHVSDDGKLEKMESKIENGYIIFETTHFSFYAIVDETEKEEPVNPPKPKNPNNNCSCICHKGGISAFFYKIALFFWKLFKMHKECSCGVMHY